MFFKNWMSYIKDDVKITDIVIPASHNSGTRGMLFTACCQDGTLYEQFCYGVREFGLFYKSTKFKGVRLAHGPMCGEPLEEALKSIAKIIENCGDEFFIIDMRPYSVQKIGPFTFHSDDNLEYVESLIAKYLQPEKYAFTDFENARDVTIGDIRKSGKKYILHSRTAAYKYSVNARIEDTWSPEVHGYKVDKFARECVKFFETVNPQSFYWFQTQQTPGLGTENSIFKWPRELDEDLRPYFKSIINAIAENPDRLAKANIIGGDFMTKDYMKACEILRLNLLKNTVIEEKRADFEAAISSY